MIKFEELKGLLIVDISGKYPITSARGNKYILSFTIMTQT